MTESDSGTGPEIVERGTLGTPSLPEDSRRLQALYSMAESLVASLRTEELLPRILEALYELFAYDRCAVVGHGPDGELVTWASRPEATARPFSRAVAERVLRRGEALLYDDIRGEAPAELAESAADLGARSVLCSPLVFRGHLLGLVYVDRSVPGEFDLEDLAALRSVCALVAVALENGRLYAELHERFVRASDDLQEAERRLLESERAAALGQLALAIAHEVRNPVTVIGGMARRLGEDPAAPESAEIASAIRDEAARLEDMLRRVEAITSLPDPRVRPTPLSDTVDRLLEEVRPSLARRGVSVSPPDLPGAVAPAHDPTLTTAALRAVLEYEAQDLPRGSTLRMRTERRGDAWTLILGECPDDAPSADPGQNAPWSVDLRLALAQRAMSVQGGDLEVWNTDPPCVCLVLPPPEPPPARDEGPRDR